MEKLMRIVNIKNILQSGRYSLSGIFIIFQSDQIIENGYVYIVNNDIKKYFKIIETSCNENSECLIYKAIEFGYHKDKISKTKNLDIRNYLNHEIFILDSKEELMELEKRASYS